MKKSPRDLRRYIILKFTRWRMGIIFSYRKTLDAHILKRRRCRTKDFRKFFFSRQYTFIFSRAEGKGLTGFKIRVRTIILGFRNLISRLHDGIDLGKIVTSTAKFKPSIIDLKRIRNRRQAIIQTSAPDGFNEQFAFMICRHESYRIDANRLRFRNEDSIGHSAVGLRGPRAPPSVPFLAEVLPIRFFLFFAHHNDPIFEPSSYLGSSTSCGLRRNFPSFASASLATTANSNECEDLGRMTTIPPP